MNEVNQAGFFNRHPTFYPFRQVLAKEGFDLYFRPRDYAWKQFFSKLSLVEQGAVLEVGCGTGVTLARLETAYKIKGWGIDISKESIKLAKKLWGSNLQFLEASATKMPFPDETFDAVFSFDVLEHINDQKKVVEEMIRVLKKGGKLLVYTINKKQKFTFNWWLSKLGVDVYESVAHDPKLFVDPQKLIRILERSRIKVKEVALYDAFFSLGLNEVMTLLLMLFVKMVNSKESSFTVLILRIASIVSLVTFPVTRLLDWPWTRAGYSNSFFILGERI